MNNIADEIWMVVDRMKDDLYFKTCGISVSEEVMSKLDVAEFLRSEVEILFGLI